MEWTKRWVLTCPAWNVLLLTRRQLILEKQLWLLTGLQMQSMGRDKSAPVPACDTGRILELYGNLCKFATVLLRHAAVQPLTAIVS